MQQNTATDGQITLYSTYKDESTTVTTQNYEVPGLKSSTKAPGKNSWPSSGASDVCPHLAPPPPLSPPHTNAINNNNRSCSPTCFSATARACLLS